MSQEFLEGIPLKERTLQWFARKQYRGKSKGTLWPSEASVKITNEHGEEEILGKCARAVYYRLTGVKPTNPPTAGTQVIFLLGNSVEDAVTEAWKQMGIWENNSVKWEDKARNLSGEFDVVCREGDMLYGVEVKSFYGYYANKKILGHHSGRGANKVWNPGNPKPEHLLQAALYCDYSRGTLNGFKLFYVSRDACDMCEFNITVNDEGQIYINGNLETRFTMADVYLRYAAANSAVDNEIKPGRDFEMFTPDARVEVLHERGVIAKSAYEAHIKGRNLCKDWHCTYCDFQEHCQVTDVDGTVEEATVVAEVPDEIMHGSL